MTGMDGVEARHVTPPVSGAGVAVAGRRGDLDLLRGLVVLGLVFFHTAVIFGPGELPIKHEPANLGAAVFVAFGATWGMPLLFMVAGMGVFYSLRSRTPGQFVRERLRRLLVPLVFGVLTLVPLQVYLGLMYSHQSPGGFWEFYRRWLDVRPSADFPFLLQAAGEGPFGVGHLWFLVCLLAYSLLLLPVFLLTRRFPAEQIVDRTRVLSRTGMLVLPALPLVLIEVAAGSEEGMSGWNRYSYAILLAYGYLAAADARIGAAMRRYWRLALGLAFAAFAVGLPVYAAANAAGAAPFVDHDAASMVFRLLKTVDGWLWIVAIMGAAGALIARRAGPRLAAPPAGDTRTRRLGAYANEAVLPFYVLHETVIIAVAYVVLSWPIGGAAQYAVIAVLSLTGTLLLYDVAVRRTPPTRWLFGLRPMGRSTPPPRAAAPDDESRSAG
jgi:surface polysaccharide O-acyltransferase-like enzyme